MLEELNDQVSRWAREILEAGERFTLQPPTDQAEARLSAFLFQIRHGEAQTRAMAPGYALIGRYLVSAQAEDVEHGHRILSRALQSAYERHDMRVELDDAARPSWGEFQCRPRPYFFLELLATWTPETVRGPPVQVRRAHIVRPLTSPVEAPSSPKPIEGEIPPMEFEEE